MPCKWHGWEHDCVVNDCIFDPQGPRIVFDKDCSVIYVFSSKHKCSIRDKEHAQSKLVSEASDNEMEENEHDEEDEEDQSHPYYVLSHDPAVFAQLHPDVRGTLDDAITKKRAVTVDLINDLVSHTARSTSFSSMQGMYVEAQKTKFCGTLRNVVVAMASPVLEDTLNKPSEFNINALTFDKVTPYPLPSLQYLQEAFVQRILELLPSFERSLQMVGGSILWEEKSYKDVNFVFAGAAVEGRSTGQGSTKAYGSVYTVMNYTAELEVILSKIRERFKLQGYEEVKLFDTDSCCKEYPMLT
jgi:hypothetical protein